MLKSSRAAGSLAVALITASALMSACSGEAADTTATVIGTDDACTLENDIIEAGKVGFEFTNDGRRLRLYVLNGDGDVRGRNHRYVTLTVDSAVITRCKPADRRWDHGLW
jgi:hypothetical protein